MSGDLIPQLDIGAVAATLNEIEEVLPRLESETEGS